MEKPRGNGSDDRLCYFLVCFNSREFVAFLLASLFREQDLFFVHCDKKAPLKLKAYLDRISREHKNIFILKSQHYSWAGYSHVAVSLQAIAAALALPQRWKHLIFLSEQHLPLRSPDEITEYLKSRRSLVALRAAGSMVDDERADMQNRFGAHYRELPGVGCFAVSLVERDDTFLQTIFHGSNWIVLHRDHCDALVEAEKAGRFDAFRHVVHAEETAIQSILAPLAQQIENLDPTLVAWPHLTDNHSLVMSEALFKSAMATNHLFIRKRTERLTPFVHEAVVRKHFYAPLYASQDGGASELPFRLRGKIMSLARRTLAKLYITRLRSFLRREFSDPVNIRRIDPQENGFTPQIHLVLHTASMRNGMTVRVLSENLIDFRVCIAEEPTGGRAFEAPYVSEGKLYSTIRARIHLLFGYRDILPIDVEGGGFVSVRSRLFDARLGMVACQFLHVAAALSRTDAGHAGAEASGAG
jgi:hypothetical protein